MDVPTSTFEQIRSTLVDLAIRFGPRLFTALLIIVAGILISRWVGRLLARALERLELEPPVRALLTRIGRGIVFALFVIMSLQNLGVQLLPLIAGLGVVGAGLALAMQGLLSDLAAGLSIIFTKPFRVGEFISIAGEEGVVEDITLSNTTLSHVDESRVVIPNRKIVGEILHNFGKLKQLDIIVGVSYETDLDLAFAAIDDVLRGNARVLREPSPLVQALRLADSCVEIAIKPWVAARDCAAAVGEINKAIIEIFRDRKITIPFPQCEVRLLNEPRDGGGAGPGVVEQRASASG